MIFSSINPREDNIMADYNPIVGIARDVQLFLIPDNCKPSLASGCTQFISDLTKHEEAEPGMDWFMKELGARIGALSMPFFVSLSVLQLGGALVSHASLMVLNGDWDFELLSDYFVQILKMTGAVFVQIISCPISVIDPTVYQREEYIPAVGLKDAEIAELRQEIAQKDHELYERGKALLPTISLKTFDDLHENIDRMPGLSCKRWEYEVPRDHVDSELSFSTWAPGGEETIKIQSFEKFLCPPDTLDLEVDFSQEHNHATLVTFLEKPHDVDRIVLKRAPSVEFLLTLPEEGTAFHYIHTLVLENVTLTKVQLETIALKFPNIACYHLDKATIDEEVPEFRDRFIYFEPKVDGHVHFQRNNVQEQYDDFNRKLKVYVDGYSQRGFAGDLLAVQPKKLLHPAAPFIRTVSFLRGTEVRDGHLDGIQRGLREYFPNMRILDLSRCSNLTASVFTTLGRIRPQEVYLMDCSKYLLYYRLRQSEIQEQQEAIDQGNGYDKSVQGRVYRFDSTAFTTGIIGLFLGGTDNIRLQNVEGVYPLLDHGIKSVISTLSARNHFRDIRISYLNPEKVEEDKNESYRGSAR